MINFIKYFEKPIFFEIQILKLKKILLTELPNKKV